MNFLNINWSIKEQENSKNDRIKQHYEIVAPQIVHILTHLNCINSYKEIDLAMTRNFDHQSWKMAMTPCGCLHYGRLCVLPIIKLSTNV